MKILKTTLLLLCISFAFTSANAQEIVNKAKGSYFTNGSVLVNSTTHKVNDEKANSFAIKFNPKVGYFIMDNLAIGAEITLTSSKDTQESILGDIESTTFAIGFLPLARYYYNNFYGEFAFGIASQKTTTDNGIIDAESKATNIGARLGVGYAFHLTPSVAFEPSVNYSFEKIKPKDAPSSYDESLSSIFLGIGITAFF